MSQYQIPVLPLLVDSKPIYKIFHVSQFNGCKQWNQGTTLCNRYNAQPSIVIPGLRIILMHIACFTCVSNKIYCDLTLSLSNKAAPTPSPTFALFVKSTQLYHDTLRLITRLNGCGALYCTVLPVMAITKREDFSKAQFENRLYLLSNAAHHAPYSQNFKANHNYVEQNILLAQP